MEGVSVIICCYNSETRIKQVLDYLAKQNVDKSLDWEVLIVDNASTDKTAETAAGYWWRSDTPLRIVAEPKPGLSHARKKGLLEAQYAYVSFIDDDNFVEEAWVQKIYNWFSAYPNIGLLGSHGQGVLEGEIPFWFEREQGCFAVGGQAFHSGIIKKGLYGAGLSIRKSIWDDLISNGFQFMLSGRKGKELTSGEDYELCHAVMLTGYDLYYDSTLKFLHLLPKERINWKYIIKLSKSFGRTDPVINIYVCALNNYTGYKRIIRENRWAVIVYSIYKFISSWPGYLKILFRDKEGRQEDQLYHRTKYRMLESFRLFNDFPGMVKGVKHGRWRRPNLATTLQTGQTVLNNTSKHLLKF